MLLTLLAKNFMDYLTLSLILLTNSVVILKLGLIEFLVKEKKLLFNNVFILDLAKLLAILLKDVFNCTVKVVDLNQMLFI